MITCQMAYDLLVITFSFCFFIFTNHSSTHSAIAGFLIRCLNSSHLIPDVFLCNNCLISGNIFTFKQKEGSNFLFLMHVLFFCDHGNFLVKKWSLLHFD